MHSCLICGHILGYLYSQIITFHLIFCRFVFILELQTAMFELLVYMTLLTFLVAYLYRSKKEVNKLNERKHS